MKVKMVLDIDDQKLVDLSGRLLPPHIVTERRESLDLPLVLTSQLRTHCDMLHRR